MKGIITKIWSKGPHIYLAIRGEDGKRREIKISDFRPYFYVPDKDGEYKSIYGDTLRKVTLTNPGSVPRVRESIIKKETKYDGCKNWTHHEADIPYARRFLIDTGIKVGVEFPDKKKMSYKDLKPAECDIEPRIWLMDIEVEYGDGFPDPELVPRPVNAITIKDSYTEKYITLALDPERKNNKIVDYGFTRCYIFADKIDLAYFFVKLYKRYTPDIIGGYYVDFDIDYTFNWLKKLGIEINFTGDRFDFYWAYAIVMQRKGLKLKNLAIQEELITPDQYILASQLGHIYENEFDKFIWYNWQDVDLLKRLDDKKSLFDFFWGMKKFIGMEDFKSLYYLTPRIDKIALDICKKRNVVALSSGQRPVQKIKGADVFEVPTGPVENVSQFDFSNYYPGIILMFGLSPENTINPNNIKYRKDRKGIMIEVIEYMLKEKYRINNLMKKHDPGSDEYKLLEKKRYIIKILSTGVWGYVAYDKSRFCDYHIPNTITEIARDGLNVLKDIAEIYGYKVIAGDTDSIFVICPREKALELNKKLIEGLSDYFSAKYNIDKFEIELAYEKFNKKILFTGKKKRYASWIIWEKGQDCDYIKITGFDTVKSDQSVFTKDKQKELIHKIVKSEEKMTKDDVIKWIKDAFDEFKNLPIDDIALTQNITKPFDEYQTKPPIVRGAILANMYLGANVEPGFAAHYLYVNSVEGVPTTDVITFDDPRQLDGRKVDIDMKRMFNVELIQKIESILMSCGIDISGFSYNIVNNEMIISYTKTINDW